MSRLTYLGLLLFVLIASELSGAVEFDDAVDSTTIEQPNEMVENSILADIKFDSGTTTAEPRTSIETTTTTNRTLETSSNKIVEQIHPKMFDKFKSALNEDYYMDDRQNQLDNNQKESTRDQMMDDYDYNNDQEAKSMTTATLATTKTTTSSSSTVEAAAQKQDDLSFLNENRRRDELEEDGESTATSYSTSSDERATSATTTIGTDEEEESTEKPEVVCFNKTRENSKLITALENSFDDDDGDDGEYDNIPRPNRASFSLFDPANMIYLIAGASVLASLLLLFAALGCLMFRQRNKYKSNLQEKFLMSMESGTSGDVAAYEKGCGVNVRKLPDNRPKLTKVKRLDSSFGSFRFKRNDESASSSQRTMLTSESGRGRALKTVGKQLEKAHKKLENKSLRVEATSITSTSNSSKLSPKKTANGLSRLAICNLNPIFIDETIYNTFSDNTHL